MKNEKTRGERGAYSHYILVIAVVSHSVVLYLWHCVFRIALIFHVIDGRNCICDNTGNESSYSLLTLPLPLPLSHVTWHRFSSN